MADAPPPGGGGNLLTRKIGPAPAWVYGVAASVAGFLYIRHSNAAGAQSGSTVDSSGDSTDSTDTDDDTQASIDELQSELDDDEDMTSPADTASPAVYSGPGSSPTDPLYLGTPPNGKSKGGNTGAYRRVVSVVKADDTVSKFLARYGLTLAELRKDNPGRRLSGSSKLKPGEKLHIPAGDQARSNAPTKKKKKEGAHA